MKKTRKTFFILTLVFILLAIAGGVAYNLIGSTVDANGMVQEPFFLIPLSFLCAFLGLVSAVVTFVLHLIYKRRQKKLGREAAAE